MHNLDTPVICALNGSAAGYGMDMALGCDIRIMAEEAKMAAAATARGIVPESGGTWILPRLLGWSKAAELIFTGRTLTRGCLSLASCPRWYRPQKYPSALELSLRKSAPMRPSPFRPLSA